MRRSRSVQPRYIKIHRCTSGPLSICNHCSHIADRIATLHYTYAPHTSRSLTYVHSLPPLLVCCHQGCSPWAHEKVLPALVRTRRECGIGAPHHPYTPMGCVVSCVFLCVCARARACVCVCVRGIGSKLRMRLSLPLSLCPSIRHIACEYIAGGIGVPALPYDSSHSYHSQHSYISKHPAPHTHTHTSQHFRLYRRIQYPVQGRVPLQAGPFRRVRPVRPRCAQPERIVGVGQRYDPRVLLPRPAFRHARRKGVPVRLVRRPADAHRSGRFDSRHHARDGDYPKADRVRGHVHGAVDAALSDETYPKQHVLRGRSRELRI